MSKNLFLEQLSVKQHVLFDELRHESERSTVIVGAANIDALLEELIVKVLKPVKPKDSIFESNNLASTFSSKILLAYQLGLISEQLYKQLTMLRKIRNDFSHKVTGCKLDMAPHSNRFDDLYKSISADSFFASMPKVLPGVQVDESKALLKMKLVVVYLSAILIFKINEVTPIYDINSSLLSRFNKSVVNG